MPPEGLEPPISVPKTGVISISLQGRRHQNTYKFNTLPVQYVAMTQIRDMNEAEQILATYIPQVKELLGKDLTLDRMRPMLAVLGNPQDQLKVVHVAGTSGKTSTTYYIAVLLKAAGKRVGHTVSPHVDSITERVQVNLQPLPESEFCHALSEFLDLITDVNPTPTYFELMIGFVYWYFVKINVDYAVIETGLGGSFDATNIVASQDKVSVITDIGLDHMHVLGNTLTDIAGQKAGIIQPGNRVFMHHQSPAVVQVFKDRCAEQQAILNVLSIEQQSSAELQRLPLYQQRNWLLAKAAYDYVAQRDSLPSLNEAQMHKAMHVQVPGRMDVKQVGSKTVIMDGAHNEQKMTAFVASFQKLYPEKTAVVVLALKEGKEYQSVLPLLEPITARLILTTFDAVQDLPARSIYPNLLAAEAKKLGHAHVQVEPDSSKAFSLVLASPEEICIITGSFYLLSCLRPAILNPND